MDSELEREKLLSEVRHLESELRKRDERIRDMESTIDYLRREKEVSIKTLEEQLESRTTDYLMAEERLRAKVTEYTSLELIQQNDTGKLKRQLADSHLANRKLESKLKTLQGEREELELVFSSTPVDNVMDKIKLKIGDLTKKMGNLILTISGWTDKEAVFKTAWQDIKQIVVAWKGEQHPGLKWNLKQSDLNNLQYHTKYGLLKGLQQLLVTWDMLPATTRYHPTTALEEIVTNGEWLVRLAAECKNKTHELIPKDPRDNREIVSRPHSRTSTPSPHPHSTNTHPSGRESHGGATSMGGEGGSIQLQGQHGRDSGGGATTPMGSSSRAHSPSTSSRTYFSTTTGVMGSSGLASTTTNTRSMSPTSSRYRDTPPRVSSWWDTPPQRDSSGRSRRNSPSGKRVTNHQQGQQQQQQTSCNSKQSTQHRTRNNPPSTASATIPCNNNRAQSSYQQHSSTDPLNSNERERERPACRSPVRGRSGTSSTSSSGTHHHHHTSSPTTSSTRGMSGERRHSSFQQKSAQQQHHSKKDLHDDDWVPNAHATHGTTSSISSLSDRPSQYDHISERGLGGNGTDHPTSTQHNYHDANNHTPADTPSFHRYDHEVSGSSTHSHHNKHNNCENSSVSPQSTRSVHPTSAYQGCGGIVSPIRPVEPRAPGPPTHAASPPSNHIPSSPTWVANTNCLAPQVVLSP